VDEKLKGKRILIVDDEPDIIEVLRELLDGCAIDSATDFQGGRALLEKNLYDVAILDIMGVKGYDLLEIATEKGIPTLMLTAHALDPENFQRSITRGAHAFIPKDKLSDIEVFLKDVLEAHEKGTKKMGKWYERLENFFEEQFGAYWQKKINQDPEFWKKYI
jgi:CheY-like chemotaxis protein